MSELSFMVVASVLKFRMWRANRAPSHETERACGSPMMNANILLDNDVL